MHAYYKIGLTAFAAAFTALSSASAAFVNYSDLPLSANSYFDPSGQSGSFESNGFLYSYSGGTSYGMDWWGGMTYSNMTDTTTAGYTNQYSAITGGGMNDSGITTEGETYVIAYQDYYNSVNPSADINPESGASVQIDGIYLSNTTYAYLSMLNGDSYAKKFGGETGNDKDYFFVTITGYDSEYNQTGVLDYYLADFRFDDNSKDYILNTWGYADFNAAGFAQGTSSFTMQFSTSDMGSWGPNTPYYAAIGGMNISAIPEPAAYAGFFGVLALAFAVYRRKCTGK